jgi:hypothetical protein
MIRYSDPRKFWWDVLVLVLSIFICYLLPLEIAFEPVFGHTMWWHAAEYFIEAIFVIDVLVHFNTSEYDKDGNEVFDYIHIAKSYLSEFHFWIDMLATIPLGVICYIINEYRIHQ